MNTVKRHRIIKAVDYQAVKHLFTAEEKKILNDRVMTQTLCPSQVAVAIDELSLPLLDRIPQGDPSV